MVQPWFSQKLQKCRLNWCGHVLWIPSKKVPYRTLHLNWKPNGSRSGLVVACLTAVQEVLAIDIYPVSV